MYRSLVRYKPQILSVRVERVQSIGGDGARAEGIDPDYGPLCIAAFHELWDSINAKRGYSWESNPWVWVVEVGKGER
jgi:hypothetical protein